MISHITIRDQSGHQTIDVNDLLFFQRDNHFTIFHLTGFATIVADRPFEELEMDLANSGFFRINKNTVINLCHLQSFTTDSAILSDGTRLTIARKKTDEFQKIVSSWQSTVLSLQCRKTRNL
jgi:DNA-binding LytR/AlgR family response regulator